jgi:hypothetical protein
VNLLSSLSLSLSVSLGGSVGGIDYHTQNSLIEQVVVLLQHLDTINVNANQLNTARVLNVEIVRVLIGRWEACHLAGIGIGEAVGIGNLYQSVRGCHVSNGNSGTLQTVDNSSVGTIARRRAAWSLGGDDETQATIRQRVDVGRRLAIICKNLEPSSGERRSRGRSRSDASVQSIQSDAPPRR